jgi:hypothetical protein
MPSPDPWDATQKKPLEYRRPSCRRGSAEAGGSCAPQRADPAAEIEAWIAHSSVDGLLRQAADEAEAGPDDGCLACHGNAGRLIGMVTEPEAPPEDGCAAAPTRPHFLGYFVNPEFSDSLHGRLGCTGCHGGDADATEMAVAHAGLKNGEDTCASCHAEIVERHETSLHHTLNGMWHALELRAGVANMPALDMVWQQDCATCHTTCSDCHLTLPEAVGGGLIKGHEFLTRPPMEDSCALCHGSRAGAEYLGQNEGVEPDIHFEAGMHCLDCHTNDMHGDGTLYTSRWDVAGRAQCTDCHAGLPEETVAAHNAAHADVACQVCHAQPYQNCFDCHTGEEDGAYFRHAGAKELMLKIGRNTAEGYPYGFVTLRNNPVARDSFDHFGAGLLPHFDDYPTWKTAAPHSIRRITPQNESCANCHDDESLFLTGDDLDPDGSAANLDAAMPAD